MTDLHNTLINALVADILERLPPEATRDMVIEVLREHEVDDVEVVE